MATTDAELVRRGRACRCAVDENGLLATEAPEAVKALARAQQAAVLADAAEAVRARLRPGETVRAVPQLLGLIRLAGGWAQIGSVAVYRADGHWQRWVDVEWHAGTGERRMRARQG